MTLNQFVYERYWPKVKVSLVPEWQVRTEALLKMIVSELGTHELTHVTPELVEGWWLYLLSRYKTPVTPNKALTRAKHIMRTAIRWKLATDNPFTELRKRREPEHQFTPLTNAEHALLLDAACDSLKWYIVFARYTGARRSSLARLEIRDVDMANKTFTFRETKNGEDYSIPIHPALVPWCEWAKQLHGDALSRVLPQYKDPHTITVMFKRLTERCGVKAFRFHDYRHNVGSQLAANGHGTKVIMSALGHKDVRMSVRYTHISHEVLSQAMANSI